MLVWLEMFVCVYSLPILSLFVNMYTDMCTKVDVGTYEHVCECLDNLVCSLDSRSGSVYLYIYLCAFLCVFVCVCLRLCVCLRPLFEFESQGIVGIFRGLFVNINGSKFYFIRALFYDIIPRWLLKLVVF